MASAGREAAWTDTLAGRYYRDAIASGRRVPPGNRLEKLTGNRAGQHSIRVNDQFRICFTWTAGGPTDVEIVDYH